MATIFIEFLYKKNCACLVFITCVAFRRNYNFLTFSMHCSWKISRFLVRIFATMFFHSICSIASAWTFCDPKSVFRLEELLKPVLKLSRDHVYVSTSRKSNNVGLRRKTYQYLNIFLRHIELNICTCWNRLKLLAFRY